MKSFKCQKCGFSFSIEADFENMREEEYEAITLCPCGEKMDEVEYSLEHIPVINI